MELAGFNGVYAILTSSNVFSQQTETAHTNLIIGYMNAHDPKIICA